MYTHEEKKAKLLTFTQIQIMKTKRGRERENDRA